jgi:hypothetical protein
MWHRAPMARPPGIGVGRPRPPGKADLAQPFGIVRTFPDRTCVQGRSRGRCQHVKPRIAHSSHSGRRPHRFATVRARDLTCRSRPPPFGHVRPDQSPMRRSEPSVGPLGGRRIRRQTASTASSTLMPSSTKTPANSSIVNRVNRTGLLRVCDGDRHLRRKAVPCDSSSSPGGPRFRQSSPPS